MAKIETQHQWADKLIAQSSALDGLDLKRKVDFTYAEKLNGKFVAHDTDAYNMSNSDDHQSLFNRAFADLRNRMGDKSLQTLIGELTFRKTYGAFSEIAAYDWIAKNEIEFETQVPLGSADVVNPNGSTIDGRLKLGTKDVFFDIKGFGFYEHKLAILKKKLEGQFPGEEVVIEGGTFGSIDSVQSLLEWSGFNALLTELRTSKKAIRAALNFQIRTRRRVSISVQEPDPVQSANNNREYPLSFGAQFARNAPFILFFVIHPWFSQGSLHQNFSGYTDSFCKNLSRLTFTSFANDQTIVFGLEKRDLAKLLSGIAFINVWPQNSSMGSGASSRIFLNKNARYPLNLPDFKQVSAIMGNNLMLEEV